MKSVYIKRGILIISLFITIIAYVLVSQEYIFYNFDSHTVRVKQFYQEENDSLDIVFLGASEVYTGYSPAIAYDEYGVTSYPFVLGANPASLYKSQLKEVLSRQTPQLVVVEINGFIYPDDDMLMNEEKIRRYVDNIPMSKNKIESILEVDYEDKTSCFLPFIKYHGISTDLRAVSNNLNNKVQIVDKVSKLKGMSTYTHMEDVSNGLIDISGDKTKLPLTRKSEEYLIDFLDFCESNNIDNVLFVRFPHPVKEGVESYDCYARSNTVESIVKEHGFQYIGFDDNIDSIGINYRMDFYDVNHLNVYEQIKMTRFFTSYIIRQFGINPKEQTKENIEFWEESVRYSRAYLSEMKERTTSNTEDWPYENVELINEICTK